MRLHHLRNATCVIESGKHCLLVDPMLGEKKTLPPFAYLRHKPRKNPTVPLPVSAVDILGKVTHCLITHSQKFGVRALQHTDHLDGRGEAFLRENNIPVITCAQDAAYLLEKGLKVVAKLRYWQPEPLLGGEITAVPAQHGHGWIHRLMANGAGFHVQLPNEPSVYISGDTVYTIAVKRALAEFMPDIALMASGSASLDVGGPILMPMTELLTFARTAPGTVIANHLEALNHCTTTRRQLSRELSVNGLSGKVIIPNDGETVFF